MSFTNSSSTSSSSPLNITHSSHDSLVIFQLVCYSVILVVGSVGNLLLIVSIALERRNNSSRYFIINLACADFLTCSLSISLDISILAVGHWPFGNAMCNVVYPLQTTLISVSVYTLLCMSFERYRAIIHPFKSKLKGRIILLVCVGIWVFSVLIVSPYSASLKYNGTECVENWPSRSYPRAFTMSVFLILFAIPLSIITVTYARVGMQLRKESNHLRCVFGESTISNSSNPSKMRAKRNVRIVKIFVCAVVAFAVCLSPFQIMWLWAEFGNGQDWSHFNKALTFANVIVYANSVVNPFIFGALAQRCRCFRTRERNSSAVRISLHKPRKLGRVKEVMKTCSTATGPPLLPVAAQYVSVL